MELRDYIQRRRELRRRTQRRKLMPLLLAGLLTVLSSAVLFANQSGHRRYASAAHRAGRRISHRPRRRTAHPRRTRVSQNRAARTRFHRLVKRVTVTGYCLGPCRRCETHGITCVGNHGARGVAVARRGALRALPLGAKVWIPSYGWARVDDVGGKVRSNQLDLRFASHRAAARWGKRQVKILAVWSPEDTGIRVASAHSGGYSPSGE